MKQKKIVAVIGGMSTASSDHSKALIYDLYRKKTGGKHCPQILGYDLDVCEVEELQKAGDTKGLYKLMMDAYANVSGPIYYKTGEVIVIICSNTMHEFADVFGSDVSFLDIRKITAKAVIKAGLKKVALLGTNYTMEKIFYRKVLEKEGLEVIIPNEADRAVVHRIIYEELIDGVIRSKSLKALLKVIAALQKQGAEGIVLGCTELPLLLKETWVYAEAAPIQIFNTTALQAEAAVNYILGE